MPEQQPTTDEKLTALHNALEKFTGNINRRFDSIEQRASRLEKLRDDDDKRKDDEEEGEGEDEHKKKDAKKHDEEEEDTGEGDPEGKGKPEPMASDDNRLSHEEKEKWVHDHRPRADDEARRDALLEAQHRANEVCWMWGAQAQRPMDGDNSRSYALRQMRRWQKYSPQFEKVDLKSIGDPNLFVTVEKQIYADAIRAATDNDRITATLGPKRLREVKRQDATGRVISEFYGDVEAFLEPFRIRPLRVHRFNTRPDQLWGGGV